MTLEEWKKNINKQYSWYKTSWISIHVLISIPNIWLVSSNVRICHFWKRKTRFGFFLFPHCLVWHIVSQHLNNGVTVKKWAHFLSERKMALELCDSELRRKGTHSMYNSNIIPHNPLWSIFLIGRRFSFLPSGWWHCIYVAHVTCAHLHHKSYLYSLFVHLKNANFNYLQIVFFANIMQFFFSSLVRKCVRVATTQRGQMLIPNKDIGSFWNSCFTLFMRCTNDEIQHNKSVTDLVHKFAVSVNIHWIQFGVEIAFSKKNQLRSSLLHLIQSISVYIYIYLMVADSRKCAPECDGFVCDSIFKHKPLAEFMFATVVKTFDRQKFACISILVLSIFPGAFIRIHISFCK